MAAFPRPGPDIRYCPEFTRFLCSSSKWQPPLTTNLASGWYAHQTFLLWWKVWLRKANSNVGGEIAFWTSGIHQSNLQFSPLSTEATTKIKNPPLYLDKRRWKRVVFFILLVSSQDQWILFYSLFYLLWMMGPHILNNFKTVIWNFRFSSSEMNAFT